jgi:tryptophan synthase alpha chain
MVFLVAPTTTEKRLQKIKSLSMGFIYLVSVLGVTGARQSLENVTFETLTNVKQVIGDKIPVSVGFGISKPNHVKEVINAGADGVIVGSAIVDLLLRETDDKTKLEDISKYITLMKTATRK